MNQKQWVKGPNAVLSTLKHAPQLCVQLSVAQELVSSNGRLAQCVEIALSRGVEVQRYSQVRWQQFIEQHDLDKHQGVALAAQNPQLYDLKWLQKQLATIDNALVLILEEISDPHNFGACLRTADAVGVDAVIVKKDRQTAVTEAVHKAACGASFTVPIVVVSNLAQAIARLQKNGLWLVGFSDRAQQSLYRVDLKGPIAIVMGSEGGGIRQLTTQKCDYLCNIPMQGTVECLNISVATGVALYEVLRQRQSVSHR